MTNHIAEAIAAGALCAYDEYELACNVLEQAAPCNLLVWGTGYDSTMWAALNAMGCSHFIEEDAGWSARTRQLLATYGTASVVRCKFNTRRTQWKAMLRDEPRLWLDVGQPIMSTTYDIAIVDGPAGGHDRRPGRMQSIYMTSRLVRPSGHVLVHDYDRELERAYCAKYLGQPMAITNRMAHFVLE